MRLMPEINAVCEGQVGLRDGSYARLKSVTTPAATRTISLGAAPNT